ncbi:hypothetical protein BJY52DRAFT_1226400 [Lactarius psammicola]|nr:hypothetical protein BJY52DRAFT_1226400 [Lactarius psammicola]
MTPSKTDSSLQWPKSPSHRGLEYQPHPPPPKPPAKNLCPMSFLMYNLTNHQKQLLLNRGVWSSQTITFRVAPFFPTNPNYLFTIKGFSTLIEEHVQTLIYNVWHDNETTAFAQATIEATPERDCTTLALAIRSFLNSLSVTCLNIKECGGALTPHFNIYTIRATIPYHSTWLDIRKHLSNRIYFTAAHGRGIMQMNPYTCGICCGVKHLKGLCPFPDIAGWNGLGKNQNSNK